MPESEAMSAVLEWFADPGHAGLANRGIDNAEGRTMRRIFLISFLVILPIGVSVADEYQCELRISQYVTPRFSGCQLTWQTIPPRIYADFIGTRDGQRYREIQEFPNGHCWEMFSTIDPTLIETMKSGLEELKRTAPDQFTILMIDTEQDPPVRKLDLKKSNSLIGHMDISDSSSETQASHSANVTSYLPSANARPIVTRCCGPSRL